MKITIYNSNGSIDRCLDIQQQDIALNLEPGQSFIEGWFDQETAYVVEGAAISKPPKPGPWSQFDYANKVWFDPRTADDLAKELANAKTNAVALINNAIGSIRSKFVTVIPAQDMVYQAKEAEAKAYLADPAPVEADYPFVHAEIGITGDSAWQVAQVYVNQALILRQTAAQLEAVRLGHVAMVEAADSVDAVDAILLAFGTSIQAVQ